MKPANPPDAEVVAAVLRGESERFAILVQRHQDALFRHAVTLGLDPDAAADMVQDSLVRAWESLAECRDPAHFRIWVGRILRNRCLDHLKRASTRRTTSLHSMVADVQGLEDHRTPDPEGEFARRAFHAALDRALLELPR
jgi:RNA polymerase sigma-70 factor, ECF subfamily